MDEYESVLLVKPEVFVYRIPPRATNRAYRASDWKLDAPDWTGKLHVISKGKRCMIKLLDKNTGELFAEAPIEQYPGISLETVSDSSRYFVLQIVSEDNRSAFIGIGFADRGDSFDLNVTLQDHFKWLEKSEEIEKSSDPAKPSLNLGFKDGQTITLNIGQKPGSSSRPRSKPSSAGSGMLGLIPPPPSGLKLPSPKSQTPAVVAPNPPSLSDTAGSDFLLDLGSSSSTTLPSNQQAASGAATNTDMWSDFASVSSGSSTSGSTSQLESSKNWMDF